MNVYLRMPPLSERHTATFIVNYCLENNIVLTRDISNEQINGKSTLEGKCKTDDCPNEWKKTMKNFYGNGGPYCETCAKDNGKIKAKQTSLNKYGKEHHLQTKEGMEKQKQTNLKRHGVMHALQNTDSMKKRNETMINNWGVQHAVHNNELKDKMKKTMEDRYNVSFPGQSEEVKQKMKDTCNSRYGKDYACQSEEVKQKRKDTLLKNWGVSNPTQNIEILERAQNSAFRRKIYTTPTGEEWSLQGYEIDVAPKLIQEYGEKNVTSDIKKVPHIPWTDEDGKERTYHCDFYVESLKLIIEVKSIWTAQKDAVKIQRTRKASKELGYDFRLIVLNGKKQWIEDITTSNPYQLCSTSSP